MGTGTGAGGGDHETPTAAERPAVGALVAVCEVVIFVTTIEADGFWEFAAFLGLGAIIVALVACVAAATDRFLYLVSVTFLGVAVFLTGVEFARALDNNDVRAAAVVRQNLRATIGFYVAESDKRVYIGRLTFRYRTNVVDRGQSRLLAFDKAQVTDLAIGPPKPVPEAIRQAQMLADELCDLEPPPAPARPDSKAAPAERTAPAGEETAKCFSRPPGQRSKSP